MSEITRQSNLPFAIPGDDVARLLGYGASPVPPRTSALIDQCIAEAADLVAASSSVRRIDPAAIESSPFLRTVDDAAICVVTIGPALEERVQLHEQSGDIGHALTLNVCGSVAVESAADAAERLVNERITAEGLRCSRRFSPGYGGWNVSEQQWILPFLDAGAIGVTLTNGCMMHPRKSVSFAVTIGVAPVEMRSENPCDDCEMVNCSYRRTSRHFDEGVECEPSSCCPLDRWT